MRTLARHEADAEFSKYWDSMRFEWFKVEVLQDYAGEDAGPSLESWLDGQKRTSIKLMKANVDYKWIEQCQNKLLQGVKLIRLHIVSTPYTPYIEWEVEHYRHINIKECGEHVYLVDSQKASNLDVPKGDFMIFDNKTVALNTYDGNGTMTHQTFYNQGDDITRFLELRNKLLKLGSRL